MRHMSDPGFHEIGILLYPGAQQAAVLGMTDLLLTANIFARAKTNTVPRIVVSHWHASETTGAVERVFSSAQTEGGPSVCVLPPALLGPPETADPVTTEWLSSRHRDGMVLASVCTGAFVLGEAGVFVGRPVTTHWTYEDRFRATFPMARIDTDRLIVDDGDIITAGGPMSWTDLALTLISRFVGHQVMMQVARSFLLDPPGRQQSYYSGFAPRLDHRDESILRVQRWLEETDGKKVDVAALAERAGLEERTFLRRFQKATGYTTTEYWQRLRVARAKALLQDTSAAVDRIAWDVGYSDPSAFRKVFKRIVGLSPGEYRQRFSQASIASPA
jgi:transcriptional regulator GlxA family with amidase domain